MKKLLNSADNKQTCKTWGIRIYACFLVEVGLVLALCLWMQWLADIPLVYSNGLNFGTTMIMASLLNLALCLITTGVLYAIWKIYWCLVLFTLALVLLFFTFFFKW